MARMHTLATIKPSRRWGTPLKELLIEDRGDGGVAMVEDFVDRAADEEGSRNFS